MLLPLRIYNFPYFDGSCKTWRADTETHLLSNEILLHQGSFQKEHQLEPWSLVVEIEKPNHTAQTPPQSLSALITTPQPILRDKRNVMDYLSIKEVGRVDPSIGDLLTIVILLKQETGVKKIGIRGDDFYGPNWWGMIRIKVTKYYHKVAVHSKVVFMLVPIT